MWYNASHMQLVLPLLAIVIVSVIGLLSSQKIITLKKHSQKTVTPTITTSTSESPTPTKTIAITQVIKPTDKPREDSNYSDFTYPGSQKTGNNEYTSIEDPDAITNWYKDKIKSMGFSTKSFVTTKTNNNVNNVLSATNGSIEIKVVITKMSGDTTTHIKITQ